MSVEIASGDDCPREPPKAGPDEGGGQPHAVINIPVAVLNFSSEFYPPPETPQGLRNSIEQLASYQLVSFAKASGIADPRAQRDALMTIVQSVEREACRLQSEVQRAFSEGKIDEALRDKLYELIGVNHGSVLRIAYLNTAPPDASRVTIRQMAHALHPIIALFSSGATHGIPGSRPNSSAKRNTESAESLYRPSSRWQDVARSASVILQAVRDAVLEGDSAFLSALENLSRERLGDLSLFLAQQDAGFLLYRTIQGLLAHGHTPKHRQHWPNHVFLIICAGWPELASDKDKLYANLLSAVSSPIESNSIHSILTDVENAKRNAAFSPELKLEFEEVLAAAPRRIGTVFLKAAGMDPKRAHEVFRANAAGGSRKDRDPSKARKLDPLPK